MVNFVSKSNETEPVFVTNGFLRSYSVKRYTVRILVNSVKSYWVGNRYRTLNISRKNNYQYCLILSGQSGTNKRVERWHSKTKHFGKMKTIRLWFEKKWNCWVLSIAIAEFFLIKRSMNFHFWARRKSHNLKVVSSKTIDLKLYNFNSNTHSSIYYLIVLRRRFLQKKHPKTIIIKIITIKFQFFYHMDNLGNK